ncbi:GNAT family N-acetyltransferase [Bacteroides thetaiotaomicron]|nr:GNAT family N-acetyltransferase [Bacteroides thetaiotaomicron]
MMEPTIHLRQAKVGDIPAILEIEQECFQEDSFSREQFVYLICRSKRDLLCGGGTGADDRLCLIIVSCVTRYLRIYSIAVHPDCRGRKLGQLLMERTIETAFDCRAVKITLEVKESNTPAIKLYMKNGFIPVGVKPNYYHDGSDAIYMQRHM